MPKNFPMLECMSCVVMREMCVSSDEFLSSATRLEIMIPAREHKMYEYV